MTIQPELIARVHIVGADMARLEKRCCAGIGELEPAEERLVLEMVVAQHGAKA